MAKSFEDAGNYAGAIFRIALEKDTFDRWQADLEVISGLAADISVLRFFEDPSVTSEKKRSVLEELKTSVDPLAMNLLYLLIRENSIKLLPDIAANFTRLTAAHSGVQEASVITAIPVDDDEKLRIEDHLGTMTGSKVKVTVSVDPDILGGFIARVGDRLIDGSTRTRLEKLKKRIGGRTR